MRWMGDVFVKFKTHRLWSSLQILTETTVNAVWAVACKILSCWIVMGTLWNLSHDISTQDFLVYIYFYYWSLYSVCDLMYLVTSDILWKSYSIRAANHIQKLYKSLPRHFRGLKGVAECIIPISYVYSGRKSVRLGKWIGCTSLITQTNLRISLILLGAP